MDCTCIDMDIDGDYSEKVSDKIVVAKLVHRCIECHNVIHPRDKYRSEVYAYDGSISRFKTCLVCNNIRKEMFCSFEFGMIWEAVYEAIRNSDGNIPQSHIAALIPEARDKVCDAIEAYWEEG